MPYNVLWWGFACSPANICKHSGDFGVCCVGGLGGTRRVQASEKGTPYPPPLGPIIRSISVNVPISPNMSCPVLCCFVKSVFFVPKCKLMLLDFVKVPDLSFCPWVHFANRRFDRTVPGVCGFRGLKMYSRFVNGSWFPFFVASFCFCGTFSAGMSNLSSLEFRLILGGF